MSKNLKIAVAAIILIVGISFVAPYFGIEVSPTSVFEEISR